MEPNIWMVLIGAVVGVVVTAAMVWAKGRRAEAETTAARGSAERIIEEAKKDAAAIKKEAELQAKDSVLKERAEFEKEVRDTRRDLQNQEKRLISKEEGTDTRVDSVD